MDLPEDKAEKPKVPEGALEDIIENFNVEGEDTEKMKEALKDLASNILEKGMLPKDAMGLSQEMIDGLYSFGYRLYNTGKYDKATQLFRLLIMLDPTVSKYMLGLAACFHMQKEFDEAATSYILCSLVDPTDPIPHYHASDCYMQMDKNDLAIKALEVSLERMGDKDVFDAIRDRAQVTLDMLKEKTKQEATSEKKEVKKATKKTA